MPQNGEPAAGASLRRRNVETASSTPVKSQATYKHHSKMVKHLDFMFPKVDTEYTVKTERGGVVTVIAYVIIALLVLAETIAWRAANTSTLESIQVDTSLGKRMRVNLNITFPALACQDLHVDVMDVAGDSQFNAEGNMIKIRLNTKGERVGDMEYVESNQHRQQQDVKEKLLKEDLPEDYCGPCYGAGENEDQCCNTCDEVIDAYRTKQWNVNSILATSEQCIREGRDRKEPKRMTKGEGCNLSGFINVNRVAGNFHIAMGEGIERDGRHIHTFVPDDTPNFNASHIIHELSFGPKVKALANGEDQTLSGVTKIVTKEYGTTGLFQYFIKIVPTTYVSYGKSSKAGKVETNRYFFTERFRPLMKEYIAEDQYEEEEDERVGRSKKASVQAGGGHGHDDHNIRNSILPGVFFIYEIYPFSVEVAPNSVPFTHLLIRLMATIGGVFTVVRWVDNLIERKKR